MYNVLLNKKLRGGEKIAKSKAKKEPMFAVRTKTDKPKTDWSKFVRAKKKIEYVTSGSLLEQAVYEFMEREGWDVETQQFINFDDDDNEELKIKHKHTHIDHKSLLEPVDLVEKMKHDIRKSEEKHVNSIENIEEELINASTKNSGLKMVLKVKNPSNEQLYTYAFWKVFENMLDVHYEQI